MQDTTQLSTNRLAPGERYVSLLLPYPTSLNALWGYGRGRVFKTAEYKTWIGEAHVAWLQQKRQLPTRIIKGRYRLKIYAAAPDATRRRDIGNLEKAVSDFLVMEGVIEDDHLAKSVFTEWDSGFLNAGNIRVEVTPYQA